MRNLRLKGLALTTALVALAAPGQAMAEDTLRIGVIGPTSGVFTTFGATQRQGAELALEEWGDTVAGLNIEVFYADSEANVEVAMTRLRELQTRDEVDVIVGPTTGGVGLAANEWAGEVGIPMVVAYSAPEDITMRERNHNVVRAGWTGAQPMFGFGEYVATELGYRNIVMVGQDYAFPYNQIGGFLKTFCINGGEEVTKIWHPTGQDDFSSILATLPEGDAVIYNGAGSDGVSFFRQYVDFGLLEETPLIGGSNFTQFGTLEAMGEEAIGTRTAIQYSEALETPENIAFRDAYEERFGEWPMATSEHGYVAMLMVLRAVEENGGKDREGMIEHLRATDFPDAPRGPFHLDEYGNPVQNIYIIEVQERDGMLINVPIATLEDVSQFGPFEAEDYLDTPPDSRDFPPGDCNDPFYADIGDN